MSTLTYTAVLPNIVELSQDYHTVLPVVPSLLGAKLERNATTFWTKGHVVSFSLYGGPNMACVSEEAE